MIGQMDAIITPCNDKLLCILCPDQTLRDIRFRCICDDIVGFEDAHAMPPSNFKIPLLEHVPISTAESTQIVATCLERINPVRGIVDEIASARTGQRGIP